MVITYTLDNVNFYSRMVNPYNEDIDDVVKQLEDKGFIVLGVIS
jgi:hypothetical protein